MHRVTGFVVLASSFLFACQSPSGDGVDGDRGGGGGSPAGSGGAGTVPGAGGLAELGEGGTSSDGGATSVGGSGGADPSFDRCYEGNDGCADACALVDCCAGEQDLMAECMTSCEQSVWVESNQTRCLALRVFWIDEEGCGSIVSTYETFDSSDDCTDGSG